MKPEFDTSDLSDWADGTKQPMKITANIATYPGKGRKESLIETLKSIEGQFDEIRVYCNEYQPADIPDLVSNECYTFIGANLTDNGKFYPLDLIKEPEYYFTLDDDIIYPPDYVSKTLEAIKTFGMIVTYHGRKLTGLDRKYYQGHKSYRCLDVVYGNMKIDVPGTGVTAFDTRYFHPKGLANHPKQLMSDLVFAQAAAREGKSIGIIAHESGWIKAISHDEDIYSTEIRKDGLNQMELANEIYKLNYEK